MESNTITLVQESFEKVKPIAPVAAEIFYSKLFELDPQLKPLFPSGEDAMKTQGNNSHISRNIRKQKGYIRTQKKITYKLC